MNKYVGVIFRSKKKINKEETFIVSQDLIKRGVIEKLFAKINNEFIEINNNMTILEWLEKSEDKKLYNKNYEVVDLNDIPFDDYIKIYNKQEGTIGEFIIDKYMTFNEVICDLFLSMKTDDLENRVFCEYFNRTSNKLIYTERILGLDRVIEDEQLKNKIKSYFENYKKENL